MAGFNRFGGGGFGSLYPGIGSLGQTSANRREDRFDDRGRSNGRSFERRDVMDRDFGRRDSSPRRRRYSPDPPYSSMRGRRDDRGDIGSYSLDHIGDSFSSRGQRNSDSDYNRAGRNLGPSSRGDGILGAKPGDMPVSSNTSSGSLNPQVAQQQQQLMAMMQTQSLLAAIQAQATAATKAQPPSLLQGLRMNDRGFDRMNRKRRFSPNRGQIRNRNQQGNRQQDRRDQQQRFRMRQRNRSRSDRSNNQRRSDSGKKSDDEGPFEVPYVEEKLDDEEEDKPEEKKDSEEAVSPKQKTEESNEKSVEDEAKKEDETKAKAEDDDSSPKSSLNLAGQNVDKLTKSLFDSFRRKYVCKVCKIMCTKEQCFRQHLFGRRHVKTWIESQGQSFEAVIFKKATEEAAKTLAASGTSKQETTETSKVKGEESEEKKEDQPVEADSNQDQTAEIEKEPTSQLGTETKPEPIEEKEIKVFEATYSCDTRKMAVKDGEYITITSINEARVKINGFGTGLDTEGCEFVKAVSGFHCRLCKSFIQSGRDVMKHVKGRKHQANYRIYIREHPNYETNQKTRNKELNDMLSDREGEAILLYEVSDDEEEVRQTSRYGTRQGATFDIKPIRYIPQEVDVADQSMDDKDDADVNHLEDSQDDSNENGKTMDGEDEEEHNEEEDKEETQDNEEQDGSEPEQDINENDQEGVDELLKETEEDDKIDSEEIADISLEPEISLSDITSDVVNEEEPLTKKTKAIPSARRGRKSARGGVQSGRGRGRGRGARKNAKQVVKSKSDDHNEDDDFMDGFEVIDEVNDEN